MKHYKYIFVVLVYKNIDVLDDFYKSLVNIESYKVIIVDSYFDDNVRERCREKSNINNSDFIGIENKGYSYGNNVGVQYALDHYSFDFVVISNSDIIIRKFEAIKQFRGKLCIIAPETVMLNGNKQNPNLGTGRMLINTYLLFLHIAYSRNIRLLHRFGCIFSRLSKIYTILIMRLQRKKYIQVFSAHGSFFAVSHTAIRQLHPLFCDKMFLYNEETYVALKAEKLNIPIFYCKDLYVNHLEGASTSKNPQKNWINHVQSFKVLQSEFSYRFPFRIKM